MPQFTGSDGADSLIGTGGDDLLQGLGGADTLDGGAGADTLDGGAGADTFVFRPWEGGPDRIVGFELGVDRIQSSGAYGYEPWVADTVQDGVAGTLYTWGWNADQVFIPGVTGATVEQLSSPSGPPPAVAGQTLYGTPGNDVTAGGAGDDTIYSSQGDDAIDGGAGFDTYSLALGRGSFVVTSPSEGVLRIHDTPFGPGSGFGVDTVTNVESFRLVYSNGDQTVTAAQLLAQYNQGYSDAPTAGNDKLIANRQGDAIDGLAGGDTIHGHYGADRLSGGPGDDSLDGSAGNDRLEGGPGADVLTGDVGADVFVFNAWDGGPDRVTDFQVGTDRLEFHTAYGYGPWAYEGTLDGRAGTFVTYGWDNDTVFLAGVTGVGVDALLA